jgi:hypothetical protein
LNVGKSIKVTGLILTCTFLLLFTGCENEYERLEEAEFYLERVADELYDIKTDLWNDVYPNDLLGSIKLMESDIENALAEIYQAKESLNFKD